MRQPRIPALFFLILFCINSYSFAQTWAKIIGGNSWDVIWDVHQNSDGTYIVAGYAPLLNTNGDAYLAELNSSGSIVWQKTFGDPSDPLQWEYFRSVRPTSDGGYIAAGSVQGSASDTDAFVVKVDSSGKLIWAKRFGTQSDSEDIYSVRQLQDGDYILGGSSSSTDDGAGLAIKLDGNGSVVWQNRYEVDCGAPDDFCWGRFDSLEATSDGGAIAVGFASNYTPANGYNVLWIVKLYSSGTIDWQKGYTSSESGIGTAINGYRIKEISGGYVSFVVGQESPTNMGLWLLRLDTSGGIQWQRYYASDNIVGLEPTSLDQSPDGSFFVSCSSNTNDSIVIKLNSSGDLLWSKVFGGAYGGWLSKTSDNGFVLFRDKWNSCSNSYDSELIKSDADGNYCETTTANIILQPNPSDTNIIPPTTVVSAGLTSVTINAIGATVNAVEINSCDPGACENIFFDIGNVDCGTDQCCIDERKVLISKLGTTDDYPSLYQRQAPDPKDRKIMIKGIVRDSQGNPVPNRNVYLRVLDPPDLSPYVTPPTGGDNIDNDPNSQTDPYTNTKTGGKLDSTAPLTDSNGKFETVLNVLTSRKCYKDPDGIPIDLINCDPSGDNYQVEGSFTSDFSCNPNCIKTGVIGAWKRTYIERDKMFRQGGLLAQNPSPHQTYVLVWNWANLPPCSNSPCYQIALFDATNTYELPDSEKPWVGSVQSIGSTLKLNLVNASNQPYPIQKNYYFSSYPTFWQGGPQPHGKSAGIGVISSGFFELSAGTDLIETAFKDGFVEANTTSTQIGAIPYLPQSFFDTVDPTKRTYVSRFAKIWFNNCLSGFICSDYQCCPNNHFQLLGIDRDAQGRNWGFTFWDSSKSFVHSGLIETRCPGTPDLENCKQDTTTHEIGHQFDINICSGFPLGHDQKLAWCSDPPAPQCNNRNDEQCVMFSSTIPQRSDGIDRFEINDLFLGYCPYQPDSIRKAIDPR